MGQLEFSRAEERLAAYAADADIDLAAVFVEEDASSVKSFERLIHATIRDRVEIVLLPGMLHLTVLGSPNNIREYFEAATSARVVAIP